MDKLVFLQLLNNSLPDSTSTKSQVTLSTGLPNLQGQQIIEQGCIKQQSRVSRNLGWWYGCCSHSLAVRRCRGSTHHLKRWILIDGDAVPREHYGAALLVGFRPWYVWLSRMDSEDEDSPHQPPKASVKKRIRNKGESIC